MTNLTVSCKEEVGSVTHIHVWTLATDDRDSLYLDSIVLSDPDEQKTYANQSYHLSTKTRLIILTPLLE